MHLEREPRAWAAARLAPAHAEGPICSAELWHSVPNPFDLHACVSVCLAKRLSRCVVTMVELGQARLVEAYRRHAAQVESLFGHRDLLRFDLFARAEHTPPAELAQRIRSALCERNLALCGDATSPSLASFVG